MVSMISACLLAATFYCAEPMGAYYDAQRQCVKEHKPLLVIIGDPGRTVITTGIPLVVRVKDIEVPDENPRNRVVLYRDGFLCVLPHNNHAWAFRLPAGSTDDDVAIKFAYGRKWLAEKDKVEYERFWLDVRSRGPTFTPRLHNCPIPR